MAMKIFCYDFRQRPESFPEMPEHKDVAYVGSGAWNLEGTGMQGRTYSYLVSPGFYVELLHDEAPYPIEITTEERRETAAKSKVERLIGHELVKIDEELALTKR